MNSMRCAFLLSALVGFALAASAADPIECARNDIDCFEHGHTQACGAPDGLETCQNWAAVLKKQADTGNSTATFMLGQAYLVLVHLAAGDPEQSRGYQEQAKEIFQSLVEKNPRDAQALIALGVATEGRDEKIKWLRKEIALAPNEIAALQLLSSVLIQSGEPKDLREAADVLKQAYSHQTGRNKWYLASSAYKLYEMAGAQAQAQEFQQKVKEDIGVRELAGASDSNPNRIEDDLGKSCDQYALPVLEAGTCLKNISSVVQRVTSADRGVEARRLADAAARAMLEAASSDTALQAENPAWQRTFATWLESLLQAGYESSAIHLSYARVTTGGVRLRALERAATLDPNDWEIAFRLGLEYSQRGQWKAAVQEFKRAQTHTAADFQLRTVEHHLQIAQEKSGEGP